MAAFDFTGFAVGTFNIIVAVFVLLWILLGQRPGIGAQLRPGSRDGIMTGTHHRFRVAYWYYIVGYEIYCVACWLTTVRFGWSGDRHLCGGRGTRETFFLRYTTIAVKG